MSSALEALRSDLSDLSTGELSTLVEQQTDMPSQDPGHTVGMILLWAFAHNTSDDTQIAAGLGIPVEIVFAVTANAIKSRIWERQLDIDDGVTFTLMISAAQGFMEYSPESEEWRMTEKGKRHVEENILSTPAGAQMLHDLKSNKVTP